MQLTLYQIDAFAERPFEGNPAAVMPLQEWLPDTTLQAIAEENNLSETAFFVPEGKDFRIRWFTPTNEVNLCGHATLAAGYVLFNLLDHSADVVSFESRSGPLAVSRQGELLTLDFPAQPPLACDLPAALVRGLGATPAKCLAGDDFVAVFDSEEAVSALIPDHDALRQLDLRGVIATAPSERFDFVVRFFAPKYGIPEDPVTGSAYTQLMPYWVEVLGRLELRARQISRRGGNLVCELRGDRVLISGRAVKYLEGQIDVET